MRAFGPSQSVVPRAVVLRVTEVGPDEAKSITHQKISSKRSGRVRKRELLGGTSFVLAGRGLLFLVTSRRSADRRRAAFWRRRQVVLGPAVRIEAGRDGASVRAGCSVPTAPAVVRSLPCW